MPPEVWTGRRLGGASTWCRFLAFLLMSGLGCSGCYQPAVVPPTASIPHRMVPAQPESPRRVLPPLTVPQTPVPPVNTWKPTVTERDWKYIVLHHTATETGDVQSIHEAHLKNKDKNGKPWQGIGYHFVIGNGSGMGDGEIEPTFRWKQQMHGAHAGVGEYNQKGIGIVLVGNFEKHPPSPAQLAAVKQLVPALAAEYKIPPDQIMGHRDVKSTECPGKHFPLGEVRDTVAGLIPSGFVHTIEPVPAWRN